MIYRQLVSRIVFSAMVLMSIVVSVYGQETVPADSIRLSPAEFELLPLPSLIPDAVGYEMPDLLSVPSVDVQPLTPLFKPEYYPDFYVSKSPLHKGDYNVSGALMNFDSGALYGMGRQDNIPGIGTLNAAALGYQHSFDDRFSMNIQLNAMQSNIPNFRAQSFGTSSNFSYRLNDRITLNAFGGYSMMPATRFRTYDYGGTLNMGFTERFGTEVGVRRHYNSATRQWETIPIVVPYYKFSEKFTLGVDVGGILMQILKDAVKVGPRFENPTIGPPIP